MKIKDKLTKCNKCEAVEITKASIGAKCMFCKEGIMEEKEHKPSHNSN